MSQHLRVEFMDGQVTELESRFDRVWTENAVLRTKEHTDYATDRPGPSFPVHNIRRYEFVEGYR